MTSNTVAIRLIKRVSSYIHKHHLLEDGDLVIVAVSGGADSLSLLHLLHLVEMELQLIAVYVDHGLRPDETPAEKENIQHWCKRLQVPFVTEKIEVNRHSRATGNSLEESARLLRYELLEKYRADQKAQAIAVGHTIDDQAEEFFIRLIRGSSTRGLSGMQPRNGHVIRPLLSEQKDVLESFLKGQGISWNVDSSNQDRRFLRNRVRLDLLPLLEKDFNPAIRKSVLHQMDILQKEDHFLEQQTNAAYDLAVTRERSTFPKKSDDQLTVNIKQFEALHPAIGRRVIEKCCWQMGSRPTYVQIQSLINLIDKADNSSEIHLAGGLRAVKDPGEVVFKKPLKKGQLRGSECPLPSIKLSVPAPGNYLVPELERELIIRQHSARSQQPVEQSVLRVDMDKIVFPLLLRTMQPGERFQPCNGPGKRKISRFFNDLKIPPRERPTYPLLLCGEQVVAVVGLQLDHHFRVRDTTTRTLHISWRKTAAE